MSVVSFVTRHSHASEFHLHVLKAAVILTEVLTGIILNKAFLYVGHRMAALLW